MALNGRTAIRIGAVVVGLGFLAWHQFQPKDRDAAAATAVAPAAATGKPLPPAKLVAFRRRRRNATSGRGDER